MLLKIITTSEPAAVSTVSPFSIGPPTAASRCVPFTDSIATLPTSAVTVATGPLAASPAFQADLQRLAGEQRTHAIVPVVSVGLVYRP